MRFEYNDGGRAEAGYKGEAGDCVTRSIAIATETPYKEVYDALHDRMKAGMSKAKRKKRGSSPRNGVPRPIIRKYMDSIGWEWIPTMGIGTGCTVHVREDELPSGRLVLSLSKHITAVVDGVIHDTHNPSRGGQRCVYGYWQPTDTQRS